MHTVHCPALLDTLYLFIVCKVLPACIRALSVKACSEHAHTGLLRWPGLSSCLRGHVVRRARACVCVCVCVCVFSQVNGVPVSVEALLELLANEVPDMRQRVGVPDQVVFGGQGFTLTKARLQVRRDCTRTHTHTYAHARG